MIHMKKIFFLAFLLIAILWGYDVLAQTWSFNCGSNNCLRAGVDAAGNIIGRQSGVITGKWVARAIQDIIKYFLTFLSLIAVIYVMWAGAQMLLFPSSEESSEKTKKIIVSVILGIVIIWFAWWIVSTLFFVLNNPRVTNTLFPQALAETQVRRVDFTTYSNKIRALKTKIRGAYDPAVVSELSTLVDGAYDHLPDRAEMYINKQMYDKVKKAISDYNLHRAEIDRGVLENAVESFLEQTKTFQIQGDISATPRIGDAPLSVTLEGKNVVDASGTLIGENNYIWWFRTPDGAQIIGRGKTINHTFGKEWTYTVYLTVNSESKNSRWFTDVISFEDQITIEVGQPKVHFLIYFNDQLATNNTVKIPSLEANQKILVDATQTKFSSGYTIAKTEWDFGNGEKIVHDTPPVVEAQEFSEGEYSVKITLTRNDGETFSKSITLKVGDPIASINVSNKKPNKWDTVIFQAKKASQEGVSYSWEIKKAGFEQVLSTASGPRMEYNFKDIGRYSVGLISSKWEIRDKETVEIEIESRAPIVRFTSDKVGPESPNIYILDGTSTYDPDYPDDRNLKYEWFINDRPVSLSDTNSNNSRGLYTFSEIWEYRIELQVTDKEGKKWTFKKNISIKSLLSIKLNIKPQVAKRGEKVLLSALAPNADIFEWTIGGQETVATEIGRHIIIFEKTGNYTLNLKVTDRDGNTNIVERKIYVVNSDSPFAVLQLSTKSTLSEIQKNACDGQDALIVDRVTPVSMVGDKSTNASGKVWDLTYFWKVGLNHSSTQKNLAYTFDELGCEKISLTVTDKKTWASHTSEEWIKAVNVPPRFSDIQVAVENIDQDPLRVNLKIEGAKDPDGIIRSYTWYYYTNPNETQPQGFRITTKPETSFNLPKINGRYYFSVIMEDSSGLKVDTRDLSENTFSTPDLLVNQNIATPVIDFQAKTKDIKFWDPVELSVNAKNALGQDIGKNAEYRWDVDGDGFYDIKTLEPVFQYTYPKPGEYHPKVKVTHRGLSTTKFLTINVINRLVPEMKVQVIGDKIIAYNTSSGMIQSVAWFADGKKVSENKEYLVFTPEENKFPQKLKLQISDGQDSQEVEMGVQKNPKNKVLVKKITRPLVLLSNIGNEMEETPDTVTWKDPLKPLFLYPGESSWEIQYYVIDTDIDIDTDLSGGKDDDADNKWTASYRLGRPFQVPIGNKRVTIMKIRLLKSDGGEIDTRQVRVIREFIAPVSDSPVPENTKTPLQFNLSAEDKWRLDQLNNLIKNVPEEERVILTRYTDQLWDIWYDRADRAETLLQFSQAVENSKTIPADLKNRIMEQIALIYTQGEQNAAEKDLARTVIADLLAKSSYRKELFGDGTGENTGELWQIIDNPEYYERNKSLVEGIYEKYIRYDTQISDDAKAAIRQKLEILIGKPPVNPTPETTPEENSDKDTFWSKIKNSLWALGKWFLWAIVFIFGLLGFIFVFRRIGKNKSATHEPENIHEWEEVHSGADWMHQGTQEWSAKHDEHSAPDWLKEQDSPFGSEDILKQTGNETAPDWLKEENTPEELSSDAFKNPLSEEIHEETLSTNTPKLPEEHETPLPEKNTIEKEETTHGGADIPDWLKGAETEIEPEAVSEAIPETPLPEPEKNAIQEETGGATTVSLEENIPDWLRGADAEKVNEENKPSPEEKIHDLFAENTETPQEEFVPSNSTITNTETQEMSTWNVEEKNNTTEAETKNTEKKKKKKWKQQNHWKDKKWNNLPHDQQNQRISGEKDLLNPPHDMLPEAENLIPPASPNSQ